ncbi:hypothetical protein ACQPU1_11005 [Clostridium paraputrificum]|uniref:capsular polysaccharide export protein, LipB/KpsS family n=1 Tax=Clostridium paraputrificum TaxID=29363 RepID=UPI003D355214
MESILFIHGHEFDKLNLFSKMANEYIDNNKKVRLLAFSRYELNILKMNIQCGEITFIPKQLKSIDIKNTMEIDNYSDKEIEEMLNYNYNFNLVNKYKVSKEHYYNICKLYLEYLSELVKKENINKFIMWNNSFLFDRIAWFFAMKNNIKVVVLEQGFFRPFTFTVDPRGVNFENSMPREEKYYIDLSIDNERLYRYLLKPETFDIRDYELDRKSNIYKYSTRYLYSLMDKLAVVINREEDCRIINYSLLDLMKKYRGTAKINDESISLEKKYVFIPFQVEDDSQIILNSPNIKSMNSLVKIIDDLSKYYNEYTFVFKEHPASKVNYDEVYNKYRINDRLIFLKDGNTKELIKNAEAVITVNSTVGIEALMEGKKVMTLGNAFFNISGLVEHCKILEEIKDSFENLIKSKYNKELVEKFLYELRFNYQKEFYWRNPSKIQVKELIKYIDSL